MKRIVLGTAGHIDHGKTALVRALTGVDTDRLREEKRRGITIELGFAHLALPDGSVAGVVDVPGHERFVRAMAAGAGGIDLVVLVIAADEGVMPQTREHLDICRLLGVARGIVVLTKADLSLDVAEAVLAVETVAIGVPVHPISNITGDGLAALDPYLQPGQTVVLLGSSGVGKSTLLNRLAGAEVMLTREVAADGTGRHTTTHRELVQLPGGGMVIDTPGLRELQFWEGDLTAAFEDLEALALECKFRNCAHISEPGCAVQAAVDNGTLELDRLRSWRKLQRELEAIAARTDTRLRIARKKRWKQMASVTRQKSRR
jgi:ribosome small subunit-dependent GTPase A